MGAVFDKRKSLKGRSPFRLGTTSYIRPADIVPNVEELSDRVDDIEIVLFEGETQAGLPGKETIRHLSAIAGRKALTYTVHFPLDVRLGTSDEPSRKRSVDELLRIVSLMDTLEPFAYVVHFQSERPGASPSGNVEHWKAALVRSVEDLLHAGIDPEKLCVETLSYPFELVEDIIFQHNLSVCLDVGQLMLSGRCPKALLDRYFSRVRVVHLHGVVDGKDHRDISSVESSFFSLLFSRFKADKTCRRVVTLEVFSEADLEKSLEVMEEFLK